MNFIKSSIYAVAALALSASFAACSDDNEYVPGAQSNGVYFDSSDPASINLSKKDNQASFSFKAQRTGTAAATYPLVFTITNTEAETPVPAGLFTVPANVTFADGATEADITVTCDLAKTEYDTSYKFLVTFGENAEEYAYGKLTYEFTASIPSAWSDWKPFTTGDCSWWYDGNFLMDGEDPGLPFSYRQNQVFTNQYEFLVEHLFQNTPLKFNWDKATNTISVPMGQTTNMKVNGGAYEIYFTDIATYCAATGQNNPYPDDPSFYDEKTGTFYFNAMYYGIDLETGENAIFEGAYGYYERLQAGGFLDYTLEIKYKGLFTGNDGEGMAILSTNVGDGYPEAKVMVSNELTAAQLLDAIKNGSDDAVTVAQGEQTAQVNIYAGGNYTAVIAGESDGEWQAASCRFEINTGASVSPHKWKPYGTGWAAMIDGWFTYPWGLSDQAGKEIPYDEILWPIPCDYDELNPGIYRLQSPWTQEDCPLVYLGLNKNTTPYNIIIDATNPEAVIIMPQISGFVSSRLPSPLTNVDIYMANIFGYYLANGDGLTVEDILAEGFECVLEEDVIEIEDCLFGPSVEDCSLNWKENPYGAIFFNMEVEANAPARIRAMQNARDRIKVSGIMSALKQRPLPKIAKKLRLLDSLK